MVNYHAQSLKNQIYTIIKKRLLDQKYQDGHLLSERTLADELRVSRTPVREALLRLQKEGWVRYIPQKGIIVKSLDAKNLTNIFQIRTALEVLSVQLACSHITSEQLEILRLSVEQQRKLAEYDSPKYQEFIFSDTEFHNTIIEASGNSLLRYVVEELRDNIKRTGINSLYSRTSRVAEAANEHAAIAAALERHSAEEAEIAIRHHLHICYTSAYSYIVRPKIKESDSLHG